MDWWNDFIVQPFNQRALLAAVMIGLANGHASAFVVLRRSALRVGALSHTLLPGIAVAVLVVGLSAWSAFLGALAAALFVGLAALAVSRGTRIDQDSTLAVLYTAAFSGGIILLRRLGVAQEMEDWLFGNIMGLPDIHLWTSFFISLGTVLFLTLLHRPLLLMLFEPNVAQTLGVPVRLLNYLLLGFLIVVLISSLQAVGCMLAVGLMVAPAATVSLLTDRTPVIFWGGALLGGAASGGAVILGWVLNIEQGPFIVLLLGLLFVLAFLFGPRHGLVARRRAPQVPRGSA